MAVKFVPRPLPKAAIPLMMGEVELQAQLGEGHVNIITMRELMLTRTHLGLVMDYASGGVWWWWWWGGVSGFWCVCMLGGGGVGWGGGGGGSVTAPRGGLGGLGGGGGLGQCHQFVRVTEGVSARLQVVP
jgi:hypothetical protein